MNLTNQLQVQKNLHVPVAVHFQQWAREHGRHFRYFKGEFYQYKGTHYERLEDRHALENTFLKWLARNDLDLPKSAVDMSFRYVRAMSEIGSGKQAPFYVGRDENFPAARNLVAFRNGLLDVESAATGELALRPHTADYFCTSSLPYSFHPQADCSLWEKTLHDIYEGDQDSITLLQEWVGYLLTNWLHLEKFLVLCGASRGGKGLIMTIVQHLLGSAAGGYALQHLADPFGLLCLRQYKAALVSEVNLDGMRSKNTIMQNLNAIVGRDPMPIQRKFNTDVTEVLPTRFMIACNVLPHFFDDAGALANRLLIIGHNRSFAGREDTGLKDKLVATELPGIANWALQGLCRLVAQDGVFTVGERSLAAKSSFVRESNPVAKFLRECLVVQTPYLPPNLVGQVQTRDEELHEPRQNVYRAYSNWREAYALPAPTDDPAWMGRRLNDLLPHLKSQPNYKISGNTGERVRAYPGIALKPEWRCEQPSWTP